MATLKMVAQAIYYPSKNDMDHFEWQIEGNHVEFVAAELWTCFLQNLQRKVPYVPAGVERIAHLEVEVMVCDY
jgi:hypothetical protein